MAVMTAKKSPTRWKLSEEEIHTIVETQAADNSAWDRPIHVHKRKSVKEEPADRALFVLSKRVRKADD
jgi:hypothetical protein